MAEEELENLEPNNEDEDGVEVAKTDADELSIIIASKSKERLTEIFDKVPTIDIAEVADALPVGQLIYIFRALPSSYTADFFDELNADTKERIIKAMTDKELVALLNESYADDVADTVSDLPANLASRVLKAADKDMRSAINQLLKYKEDTAGSLMTTEYISLLSNTTVGDAIDYIRKRGKDAETIYTIFVINNKREFVGTVDLDDLIFASANDKLSDIMNEDVASVNTWTDQEQIAQAFARYDLNALAVLNSEDRLVGIITIDDAVDVMKEESSEDIAHLTGTVATEKSYSETTIWDTAKQCIPWLGALLILGTFTTMVLNRLEALTIFTSLPILISFIPTLMDTGGNAGGQTTGMMIRGLATRDIDPKNTFRVLWKELRAALIVALFVGLFATVWIFIEIYTGIVSLGQITENGAIIDFSGLMIWNGSAFTDPNAASFALHALKFSSLVGLTMFIAISFSKGVGTLLCMGAAAIKKDPALLAQPMLTTIMDVLTLLIYFGMACIFFPSFA